jgi:hypothetical protein
LVSALMTTAIMAWRMNRNVTVKHRNEKPYANEKK